MGERRDTNAAKPANVRRGRLFRSAFATEVLRSIKGSMGRFLAITGIVALGCGFYAGLQMCGPDMRAAADALYDGTNLYDVRLISTLGFTRADAERVRSIMGVRATMPAVSVDAMARLADEQMAVRISSLDVDAASESDEQGASAILSDDGSYLNRVFLREGNWPQEAGECVITADKAVAGLGIGDVIEVSYGTTRLDDVLSTRSFKVVGTVSSSSYPYTGSFGSTTLGTGMIGEYLYVAPSSFVEDVPYTEMYLTVEGAQQLESGSDAYQELVDAVVRRIEDHADELAEARRDDIVSVAQAELDQARADYEAQRKEAEAQLDAAKEKLDAAAEELASGEDEYAAGVAQLEESRAQLASGQAELDAAKAQADAGTAELLSELAAQGIQASSLSEARTKLEESRDQVSEGIGTLALAEAAQSYVDQLKDAVGRYEGIVENLPGVPDGSTLPEARAEVERALDEARARVQRIEELMAALEAPEEWADAAEAAAQAAEVAREAADEAAEAARKLAEAAEAADANEALAEAAKQAQAAAEQAQAQAKAAAEQARAAVDAATKAAESSKELAPLLAWAQEQVASLEETLELLQTYEGLLDQAMADLASAQAEAERLEGVLASMPSRAELEASRSQISEGLDAVSRLEQAYLQIEANQTVITSGWQQLASGSDELASARAQLDEGHAQYEEGLAAYEASREEALEGFADAERQLDEAQERINQIELPEIYVLDRTKSEGAATYHADSLRIDSIASVFPLIFFLVAALVALTTMTRMVDDERIQIGTHKALGYSTARIASKYLAYAGAAAGLGAVLGIAALSQVLPFIVQSAYSIIYAVPLHAFPLPISVPIALSSGLLGVAITLGATWGAVVSSLREVPATLMLPRVPAAGKRILLERVGFVWRHLSFSWKVTCRNLFRYKRRLFMTVVGIAGCTALLLVGFGLHDSIWDIIDCQYGPVIHYDTTVALDDDATEMDVRDLVSYLEGTGSVSGIVRIQQENMQAGIDGEGETIRVAVVIPQDQQAISEVVTFRDRRTHEEYAFSGNSVMITEKLALKYGLGVGDTILLFDQDEIGNVRGAGHPLAVTAVVENYVGNLVYVGNDAWASVSDEKPVYSTVYASTVPDEDVRSALSESLHEREGISTMVYSDVTINLYRNMLSVVDMIVVVLIVSAGALAFIVLYNLTNINVGERVREIASLKVLGFTRGEVYAYIYREIAILVVIGDAVGMVLGTFLERFVATTAEVDYVMFGRTIHPASYGYAFALTLVFAALVMLLMRHKLDQVDMVESLKSVD